MSARVQFPPTSTHPDQVELLLEVFKTILNGRGALYVSAPVTTGKRYATWRSRVAPSLADTDPAYRRMHRESVVIPNREDVRSFVQELRRTRSAVVIDPTSFGDVPGWKQNDYRYLWGRTIEQFVHTVIFVEGWEYSDGCSYEFLVARRSGARTLKQDGSELALAEGIELIGAAAHRTRDLPGSVAFRDRVRAELSQVPTRWANAHGTEQTVRD